MGLDKLLCKGKSSKQLVLFEEGEDVRLDKELKTPIRIALLCY